MCRTPALWCCAEEKLQPPRYEAVSPMNNVLQLQRPLLAFDLETTGLDVESDRIVEICCIKLFPDGSRDLHTYRINPGKPIAPAATEVHGISDADVAKEPAFAALAPKLYALFSDCDFTGYNIERFDLPILTREFARVGMVLQASTAQVADAFTIFQRKEPRDLATAYRFYCGKILDRAHSAEADANAALDILLAQVQRYEDLPQDVSGLHKFCHAKKPDWLDPAGKIVWRNDKAVLSFGKHKNRPLEQLASEDPDYLKWIATADFSQEVISIARAALEGDFPSRNTPASTAA